MKDLPDNLVSAGSSDQFIREVALSRKIGIGLTAIRKAERLGLIRAYRPFGMRAKVYYWPEVKEGILSGVIDRPLAGIQYRTPHLDAGAFSGGKPTKWIS